MTLDELVVKLSVDNADLKAKLSESEKRLEQFGNKGSGSVSKLNTALSLAKGFVVGFVAQLSLREVIQFTQKTLELADALDDVSKAAGINVERVQTLRYAFDRLGGIAAGQVDTSLIRFTNNLGKAKNGSAELVKAFNDLGVSADLTTEQAFNATIEALAKIEDRNLRAARASKIFGEEAGPKIAAALDDGVTALTEMEAATTNLLSEEQVAKGAALKEYFEDLANTIGTELQGSVIDATAAVLKFFGVVDDATFRTVEEIDKELAELNEQIRLAQQGSLNSSGGTSSRWGTAEALLKREEELYALREKLIAQTQRVNAANSSGGSGSGSPFVVNDPEEAKKAAEYENQLLADVYAERERLIQLEAEQELQWATELAAEKERVALEELETKKRLHEEEVEMEEMLYELFNDIEKKKAESAERAKEFSAVWTSAMEDAIFNGEQLSDVIDGLIKDIARMILRAAVLGPLEQSLTGAFSGIGSGNGIAPGDKPLSGIFGGIFGKKAGGGVMQPNVPTLVGERGPELVTSNAPMRVHPNHMLGGGGKANVTVNMHNNGTPQVVENATATVTPQGILIDAWVADLQKGGRSARALTELYGVRRRG